MDAWGGTGKVAAALLLGGVVLFALWIPLLTYLGDGAFWVAAVFAAMTAAGVLRGPGTTRRA